MDSEDRRFTKPVKLAGVPRGEPMSFEQADSGAVNPFFERGAGYDRNCQACVAAYDARRRGFDVHALAFKATRAFKLLAKKPQSAWVDVKAGRPPVSVLGTRPKDPLEMLAELKTHVQEEQRFELAFYWRDQTTGGHVIAVERDANGLFVYDAQSDKTFRGLALFKYIMSIDYRNNIQLFRIDDAELNTALLDMVLGGG